MQWMRFAGRDKSALPKLATAEILLGTTLVTIVFLHSLLAWFGYRLGLQGVFGLLPLLMLFLGATLIIAGGGTHRFPAHPITCHVPLALWVVVVFFTRL